ncbi:glycoside hydrolase family 32 protein [Paenibacillus sp. Soil787]|uniref:glycoside hydrolase family 32 protein n=1 Tax=Paenibacillus sp. Soil787 TaxID=1736411 RepID=UPI0006F31D4B|nr:glycoside hydrolase family 32 protein [Paenibacillus sp. Soil787]KRF42165.1 glycoside hydrolase [Paenibacillus sp. Soil787]
MTTADYQEQFRPQLHFTPAEMWLNDPNGLVFYEEEYHLFYQYHPESTVWGPMHWGHAVSKDLVHWEHLPIALAPDGNGTIFSGSAVVDKQDTSGFFAGESGLVAIFTQHDKALETDITRQTQSIAFSKDKGRTWTLYANNPVLIEERLTDFRDPKVFWHAPQQKWVMIIAAGDHVRIYTSPNLKDWTYVSEFGAGHGSHAGVWECPDLFALPVDGDAFATKWVLIVSIGDHPDNKEGSRTQYFIGDFDGHTFIPEESPAPTLWLDYGRDNYAGVTWSDFPEEDGRRVLIGWMNNWKYANKIPTSAWRGAMTLPRELSLSTETEGIRVMQRPVRELSSQRRDEERWESFIVSSEYEQEENIFAMPQGELLEIIVELEIGDATEFGLRLSTADNEETIIGYATSEQNLFIDRTKSGTVNFHDDFACKHNAPLKPMDGTIKLTIFVDWSSVEVFSYDGKLVMTDLVFPSSSRKELKLYAKEGSISVKSLTFYTLESIYASKLAPISQS